MASSTKSLLTLVRIIYYRSSWLNKIRQNPWLSKIWDYPKFTVTSGHLKTWKQKLFNKVLMSLNFKKPFDAMVFLIRFMFCRFWESTRTECIRSRGRGQSQNVLLWPNYHNNDNMGPLLLIWYWTRAALQRQIVHSQVQRLHWIQQLYRGGSNGVNTPLLKNGVILCPDVKVTGSWKTDI